MRYLVNPADLIRVLQELEARKPGCTLVKNQVGNLSVMESDNPNSWEYIGWVDLAFAQVHLDEDED